MEEQLNVHLWPLTVRRSGRLSGFCDGEEADGVDDFVGDPCKHVMVPKAESCAAGSTVSLFSKTLRTHVVYHFC